MNKRILFPLAEGVLILGLLLASAWTYWNVQSSVDAWVIEQPEQVVSETVVGEELHIPFILRNTASQPHRILGVIAC